MSVLDFVMVGSNDHQKSGDFYDAVFEPLKLKRILKATGSPDQEIRSVLNKDFEIPITIASKLVYSEIGNVFLTRLSSIIHPTRALVGWIIDESLVKKTLPISE